MGVPGRKPTTNPRHRVKPTHDWTEVPDVPYDGPWPALPVYRTIITKNGQEQVKLQKRTRDWWNIVKRMPHAALWTDADWQFALTTALIADAAHCGIASAATELRNREKVLGTTIDFRRDLRIRYVAAHAPSEAEEATPDNVRSIDSVRDL